MVLKREAATSVRMMRGQKSSRRQIAKLARGVLCCSAKGREEQRDQGPVGDPPAEPQRKTSKWQQAVMHPINAALWNDPINIDGEVFNKSRGTGMLFGPDVCEDWLRREGLQMLIFGDEFRVEGVAT